MNFEEYKKDMLCKVQLFLGNDYEASLHEVTKNNSVIKTGIMAKRNDTNIFPTIYIDDDYSSNLSDKEIEYNALKVANALKNAEIATDFCVDDFLSFDIAKQGIVYKLIDSCRNKTLLSDIPHRRFHNLVICYCYFISSDDGTDNGSIMIHNSHMKEWGITEEDLYEAAMINQDILLPSELIKIGDIIKEYTSCELDDYDVPMYVLTNNKRTMGSSALLDENILMEASDKLGGNYYILPSSVHEVILIPENEGRDPKELLDMVVAVNSTEVPDDQILSDSVYLYDAGQSTIKWLI